MSIPQIQPPVQPACHAFEILALIGTCVQNWQEAALLAVPASLHIRRA
ncbi:MAG: hypothetical protein Q4P24_00815 [Rhodobacterales bacterium]|nr:hypothetical protein [Rhodobacterales bacterium]